MKHKNVQVGQRVIVRRSTSEFWDTAKRHIGEEFTVGAVEPLDYLGEGTVYVLKAPGLRFWCNHKDIKLVKEQAAPAPSQDEFPSPQVGDLFEVVGNTRPSHHFPVGTAVRRGDRSPHSDNFAYEDGAGARQFVSSSDLRALTKEDIWARLTAKPAAPKELSWPWPKGTRVRLSDVGKERARGRMEDPEAEYILGDDGGSAPPLRTLDGRHVFYVCDFHVVLA